MRIPNKKKSKKVGHYSKTAEMFCSALSTQSTPKRVKIHLRYIVLLLQYIKCNSEISTQEAKNSILSSVLFFSFLAGWFDAFLGGAQGQTQCTVGLFDKFGAVKVCIYYFKFFF